MTKTNHTPGPWHVNSGQIFAEDGGALASVPYTLGDQADHANAQLIAAAPDLLAAALITLETLADMSTDQFSKGADRPAREALEAAIAKATTIPIPELAEAIYSLAWPGLDDKRHRATKTNEIADWLTDGDGGAGQSIEDIANEWIEYDSQEPERDTLPEIEIADYTELARRIRQVAYPGFFTDRFTQKKIELITEWLIIRGGPGDSTPEALAAEWLDHEQRSAQS